MDREQRRGLLGKSGKIPEDGAPDPEKVSQEDRCCPNSPCIDENQPPDSERDLPWLIQ